MGKEKWGTVASDGFRIFSPQESRHESSSILMSDNKYKYRNFQLYKAESSLRNSELDGK
jgi:hypothetical protein